ncbi:MAG: hypothetical protein ACJAVV_001392 [Alphaproteobacteria bacterium]|jgi:hypothetical protein
MLMGIIYDVKSVGDGVIEFIGNFNGGQNPVLRKR